MNSAHFVALKLSEKMPVRRASFVMWDSTGLIVEGVLMSPEPSETLFFRRLTVVSYGVTGSSIIAHESPLQSIMSQASLTVFILK